MATVSRSEYAKKGQWTNLTWSINTDYKVHVRAPRGALVRLLYGSPWFGWTAKKVTLNGEQYEEFTVAKGPVPAFVQVKPEFDTWVQFLYTTGPFL